MTKRVGRPRGKPRTQVTMSRDYAEQLRVKAEKAEKSQRVIMDELWAAHDKHEALRDAARDMLQVLLELDLRFDETAPGGVADANKLRDAHERLCAAVGAVPQF